MTGRTALSSLRRGRSLLTLLLVLLAACTSTPEGADAPPTSPEPTTTDAATGAPTTASDPRGGSLRFALSADPASIDPRLIADDAGSVVVDALFDSLVTLDTNLRVVPAAASSWEVDDEGRVFTFTLREDGRFHDGTPVTAQDFVRAFNRIADGTMQPPSFLAFELEPISGFADAQGDGGQLAGVEAVDERTLRITLAAPFPEFIEILARPSLGPVPPAAEEDPQTFGEAPVGNGPFAMAEPWQRNQFIRVARFDEHPEPAYLDEVVFRIYANDPAQETQYADFAAGQLQFAEVAPAKRDEAIEQFGLSVDGYTGPGVLDGLSSTIYYYGFNVEQPPFDDPDVRRALSHLIDRTAIATELTRDTRVPADAIVPPSIPGAQEAPCGHCTFDPEQARALLEPEEGEEPLELEPLTILHNSGAIHEAIASRIAQDISEALGVEVETRGEELEQFVEALRVGEVGIFRLGWQAEYPSPGSYLTPLFSAARKGIDNLTRYDVPEVDQLLQQAREATDQGTRDELYQEAERRILEDAAIAPILFYRHDKVVAPEVRDLRYSPLGTVDLARVWLDQNG